MQLLTLDIAAGENWGRGFAGPHSGDAQERIAPDGEILTRGPHVMQGYYKRPDLTAEAIDAEGWFHTGDIGRLECRGRFALLC